MPFQTTASSISSSDMASETTIHGQSRPNDTPSDVEKDLTPQTKSSDLAWDGPDDPDNPMNWPGWRRKMQIVCVALMTLFA